jgi:hypothetical protein
MGLSNYLPSSRLIQPGVCTSTTRPASPFEGQCIFETDTDRMLIWNGSSWIIPNSPASTPVPTEFTYLPFRYQVGSTSGSGTFSVTFAVGRFTVAPMVVSQSKSIGSNVAYEFTNVPTTSGFTIERNVTGTWTSQWIAIQATSSSGAGP